MVLVAAAVLLTIIGLARRIARQAEEIEGAIEGARQHTAPLFEIGAVNRTLDGIARELSDIGEGA